MIGDEKLRRQLTEGRDRALHEAARRLRDDPDALPEAEVDRVEAHGKLLEAVGPTRPRQLRWAITAGLASVAVASLLWSLRVPRSRVVLRVTSDAATLRLGREWSSARGAAGVVLDARSIRLEDLSLIEAPGLFPRLAAGAGDAWLRVDGGEVTLAEVAVGEGGLIEWETAGDSTASFYARGAVVSGRLEVGGRARLSAGPDRGRTAFDGALDSPVPESAIFQGGEGATPLRFTLRPAHAWTLRNLPVDSLGFARQIPLDPGESGFVSGITEGSLTLHDVSETVALAPGDQLTLTGVDGRVATLEAGRQIALEFRGSVRGVEAGPEGFRRDLRPSLLFYLYRQQRLAFAWGAIAFAWSLLWSARRLLFG